MFVVAFVSFQSQRHATFRTLETVFVPRLLTQTHTYKCMHKQSDTLASLIT